MIQHLAAVWRFRYFWASLVRLDLQNRYRRSVLGVGWSLAQPLAMTVVFCVAFAGIFNQSDWRTYSCSLVCGLSVWAFLLGSATQGCEAFIRAEAYIRQCPLPFGIYPLRTVCGTLIHFGISLVLVVAAVGLLTDKGWDALWGLACAVPAIALAGLFAWGLATLFAFANVFFQDTKHLTDVAGQLVFFLTPIVFPASVLEKQGLGLVLDLNPAAHFLELFRTSLIGCELAPVELYARCGAVTAVTVGLAAGATAWLQKKVIFHL